MSFEATIEFAGKLDKTDPLRKFRKRFYFPKHDNRKAIYLCGNSLGLQAETVKGAINQELKDWKNLAINGYEKAKHPWIHFQQHFTKPLARLAGCNEQEVIVMNALTVNLHILMFSFYRPTAHRYKVIMEAGAFPSDRYAVQSQVRYHGLNAGDAVIEITPRQGEKILRTEDIIKVIDTHRESVALVLFSGIHYYTGQFFDMKAITEAAHRAGAYAGFDLAHTIGNVPLFLHEWKVDFAAWCSYKYLNGGPGSAGGVYIHEKFANDPEFFHLTGWWGNEEKTRFKMEKDFRPEPGAAGWHISTNPIFNMAALKASLEIIDEAGIENLRMKSVRLTGYLEFLLGNIDNVEFEIISPADPLQRGAQLSLFFKDKAEEIYKRLISEGIVVDFRKPGVIRLAPAPLYNSFKDIYRFYSMLKALNET